MNNFNNDVFSFGNTNEDFEQTNNFNYDSISGLGESDYENENLFNAQVDDEFSNDFRVGDFEENQMDHFVSNIEQFEEPKVDEYIQGDESDIPTVESHDEPEEEIIEGSKQQDDEETIEEEQHLVMSETPIEELNKLTDYKEETIEKTDINSLFDKVNVNVQDASEIFRKNSDLKQKIDTRFDELKKLQAEIEGSRKNQIDEVNKYKEEVLNKLTEKKEEIERRLNLLKDTQASLEKEKQEFEQYKKQSQEKIDKVQKEVQSAYDDRREELNHIEDVLRRQKDALDEERSQLSLDRIQYESDKNELANNLLKFNDLVSSFKSGMVDAKE